MLLVIFALVAAPSWFERDEAGFAHPLLNAGLIGVITLLIVPVQMLLVAFAMRGFNQGWNVEVERRDPSAGADRAQAPGRRRATARRRTRTRPRSRPEPISAAGAESNPHALADRGF